MSNSARNKQFGGMAGVALHLLAYATLALGSLFASPGLAGSGMCIRAEITQSVRLPHGEVLPPGTARAQAAALVA